MSAISGSHGHCDFCLQSYSFDDTEDNFTLNKLVIHVYNLNSDMVNFMLLATKTVREVYPVGTEEYGKPVESAGVDEGAYVGYTECIVVLEMGWGRRVMVC